MAKKNKNTNYIIGIDLGTTNCAVTYIDTRNIEDEAAPEINIFEIPQLTAPGVVEVKTTLPSFTYLPIEEEINDSQMNLPWVEGREYAVGELARKRGEEVPGRFIHSVKSWLCHETMDRRGDILPFDAPEDVKKLSPVTVTGYYLKHIMEAWNAAYDSDSDLNEEGYKFENQEILITVPASFDAAAKDLTVKAATGAGIENLTLLEEPQAAFYSWLYNNDEEWRNIVKKGDTILVFDVGGGTTDLSLISVSEEEGDLELNRFAVGNHILLGGDNMDMAIAGFLRTKLKNEGHKIGKWQFRKLCNLCRDAKEVLLSDDGEDSYTITLLGKGKSVIGGSIKTEITKDEIQSIILDGFFPENNDLEIADKRRTGGLTELGLNYANDPAITKHLAEFLSFHAENESYKNLGGEGEFVRPTAILFNGGVMKAGSLQQKMISQIENWNEKEINVLDNGDLDLAVSIGAAYYGMVKRGKGIRIRGGTGRSYYVGLETSMPAVPGMEPPIKAVCLVPAKTEEGTILPLANREFGLQIGTEAEFRFLSSSIRKEEEVGTVLEEDEWEDELEEIPPLVTTLSSEEGEVGVTVPVTIESHVTEIGTIEVWCVEKNSDRRWKLEFNFREQDNLDTDVETEVDEEE